MPELPTPRRTQLTLTLAEDYQMWRRHGRLRRKSSPSWRLLYLILGSLMLQVAMWWSLADDEFSIHKPGRGRAITTTGRGGTHSDCLSWTTHPGYNDSIGVEFVEHEFKSLHQGYFHYFHWIEFLVMGFLATTEQQRILWIRVPHMTQEQVCGNQFINCRIAQMVWGPNLVILGSDNDVDDTITALLRIDRSACVDPLVKKMWWQHMDSFDHDRWYQSLRTQLSSSLSHLVIRITYVDRQSTRRRLPSSLHLWILNYMESLPDVIFICQRMEDLTVPEQFHLVANTDILMGMHGNGLAHQFLMKPHSAVLEIFWEFPFAFDYASSAHLMGHEYRGIWNGKVLDSMRLRALDPSLRNEFAAHRVFAWWQTEVTSFAYRRAVEDTKFAISEFLLLQVHRLQHRSALNNEALATRK